MNEQRGTRRRFLGGLIGGLALVGVSGAKSVLATYNYGSKAELKRRCELEGGTYIESEQDKLTACFYPNGSKLVCNLSGNDCITYPPTKMVNTSLGEIVELPVGGIAEIPEVVNTDPDAPTPEKRHRRRKRHKR
jgi:hypothetical protein